MREKLAISLVFGCFLFLLLFHSLEAGSNSSRTAITFQGGVLNLSLEMTMDMTGGYGEPYGNWSTFSTTVTEKGESSQMGSFGIGILTKNSAGFGVRLNYQYRPESDIVVKETTFDGTEVYFSELLSPISDFSLHTISLSIIKSFTIIDNRFDLYFGGGPSFHIMDVGDGNILTWSGYPVAGLELFLSRKIGFFGEYQRHYGKTVKKSESALIDGASFSWEYQYSLDGEAVWAGMNYYFGD